MDRDVSVNQTLDKSSLGVAQILNVFDSWETTLKRKKNNDDVDIKMLSSTSQYDSIIKSNLSSHTAFHHILFTISSYSYVLYIKQLHAYRALNSTFYISFYNTY